MPACSEWVTGKPGSGIHLCNWPFAWSIGTLRREGLSHLQADQLQHAVRVGLKQNLASKGPLIHEDLLAAKSLAQVESAFLVHCIVAKCVMVSQMLIQPSSSANGSLLAHRHNQKLCDLRSHCSTSCFLGAGRPSFHFFQRKKISSIQDSCYFTCNVLSVGCMTLELQTCSSSGGRSASVRSYHLRLADFFTIDGSIPAKKSTK